VAARAIWKGVVKIGSNELPIKLYSAVQDRSIHFRLLHEKDLAPVKQQMVDPNSAEVVPAEAVHKAFPLTRNSAVILEKEDLEQIEPKPSRDIEITRFVDASEIDHRWFERAYYLAPTTSVPTEARPRTSRLPKHWSARERKVSRNGRCAASATSAPCAQMTDTSC
jgi:DNA end-binding protein Ku